MNTNAQILVRLPTWIDTDVLLKSKTFSPELLVPLDRNENGQLGGADLTILLGNP